MVTFYFVLTIGFSQQTLPITNIDLFTFLSLIKPVGFLFTWNMGNNYFGILPRENGNVKRTGPMPPEKKMILPQKKPREKRRACDYHQPNYLNFPRVTLKVNTDPENQRESSVQHLASTKLPISNQSLRRSLFAWRADLFTALHWLGFGVGGACVL